MGHKKLFILILVLMLVLTGCTGLEESGKPIFGDMSNIAYTIGDDQPNYLNDITATDKEDGDISSAIYFDDSDVDYDIAGEYTVTYYVVDSDGHLVSTSITVIVSDESQQGDTIHPQIFGASDITYTIGDPTPNYLSGIAASDNVDGDVTSSIVIDDSAVDYTKAGTYAVIYSVSDVAGNERTVSIYIEVVDVAQNTTYDIFYLNDFHGSILPDGDQLGFATIANLIMTKKEASPTSTIFIVGGDMLQGSLLSNYYQGASTIEMLNLMGLDAFVLGNHEFDWGLDVLLQYFDQNSDAPVHANFPLLAANVIEKTSGERPDGIEPYTILQRQGYKIGIVGTIGYGLESSIAASRVADYEFLDPVEWTEFYARYLRTVEGVDIVLAVSHGDSDYFNDSVAALTGDARIDMIYNGHSHQAYIEQYNRDGMDTVAIQSSSNGKAVGYVKLEMVEGVLGGWQVNNLTAFNETLLTGSNADMQDLIDYYLTEVQDLIENNIITAGEYLSTSALTTYMAKIMRLKTDSDIAFHNYGGTRTSVQHGTHMTVALAYQIFPFDNVVKTTELLGSTIKSLMGNSSMGYDTNINSFDDNTYYKVATNDYIYDGNPNTFNNGQNPVNTGLLLRDLFIDVLEDLRDAGNDTFYLNLDIPEPLSIDTYTQLQAFNREPFHVIINA